MNNGARKPTISTSGVPREVFGAVEAIKQNIEMITGARSGMPEIKGLRRDATLEQVVGKVNEILSRLNASGRC